MLILGDEGHYHGRFPWVTCSLVAINALVFAAQLSLGEPFTNGFSTVPAEITSFKDFTGTKMHKVKIESHTRPDRKGSQVVHFSKEIPIKHYPGPFPIFLTLFTCTYLHGDIFHLIGNMWFLIIFGRNVECAFGHGRFLAFYTACGITASLAHVASDPHSVIPCLGASGAISGVLGAYVSIHPLNKVKIWISWMLPIIEVPALIVIGGWFLLQYLAAMWELEEGVGTGVAYWAHIGGFVAGFVFLRAYIIYLQRQLATGSEEEPLVPPVEVPLDNSYPAGQPNPLDSGVAAGAPDPFATFLSVKTVREMQDRQKQQPTGS